jgi:hypothetical protein
MKNKKLKGKKGLKKVVREQQHEEMQLILHQVEIPVIEKFSNESLDRANEIKFLSGEVFTWKELVEAHFKYKRFIAAKKRDYEKTFPDEIYDQWRRLNGWNNKPHEKHHKPPIFGRYTKLFVYGRLPREILPTLEGLNNYIYPGIRLYKHFELVTDETYADIKGFIRDVISLAKMCNDMYEFRLKYAAKYGKPFSKSVCQMDAFRDNDNILGSI